MTTQKWTDHIDQLTLAFQTEFGGLTAKQLNWKPDSETWSVAQVLDHLIHINTSYEPVIQAVREGTYQLPFLGRFGFMVNFFGNFVLKSVQPETKKKIKTFPIWEPATSALPADILDRFVQNQSELKQLIVTSQDLLSRGVVISSPANRMIVYKLETAFDIIVAHEERHLEQARQVYAQQKAAKS